MFSMNLNNTEDLTSFGFSILTGIVAGIIYDLLRAFRYTKKPRKKFNYLGDLIFWLIITIVFFITTVKVSEGILRGFLFIGFFTGGALYILTVSKYVFSVLLYIFKLISKGINEIIKVIKIPTSKLKLRKRISKINLIRKEMKKQRKKHWKLIRGKK